MQHHASTKTYLTDIGNALAPERRLVKVFSCQPANLDAALWKGQMVCAQVQQNSHLTIADNRYSFYADRGIVAHQESLQQAGCAEKECFATAGHRYTCNT
ncbi:TPA: hypothetical protein ACH3X1_005057 [Trebouxia sp. C0004]